MAVPSNVLLQPLFMLVSFQFSTFMTLILRQLERPILYIMKNPREKSSDAPGTSLLAITDDDDAEEIPDRCLLGDLGFPCSKKHCIYLTMEVGRSFSHGGFFCFLVFFFFFHFRFVVRFYGHYSACTWSQYFGKEWINYLLGWYFL